MYQFMTSTAKLQSLQQVSTAKLQSWQCENKAAVNVKKVAVDVKKNMTASPT